MLNNIRNDNAGAAAADADNNGDADHLDQQLEQNGQRPNQQQDNNNDGNNGEGENFHGGNVNNRDHNNNVEDDDDEDDVEGMDDAAADNGGIIEGGVAGGPPKDAGHGESSNDSEPKRKSTECDLYVLIECIEKLQDTPTAVCSTVGAVVSIGLPEKTTKMATVFRHFCNFCSLTNDPLYYGDVEFVHNDVISHIETAEGCAVMKGDKIKVRRVRTKERMEKELKVKVQRESDKEYFRQLRCLFLESVNSLHMGFPLEFGGPNMVIECRPYLETGQRGMLNPVIMAHETLVSKRCPWLKEKIEKAKQELERLKSLRASAAQQAEEQRLQGPRVVRIPDVHDRDASCGMVDDASLSVPGRPPEIARRVIQNAYDDDDDDAVMHYDPENRAQHGREHMHPGVGGLQQGNAAQQQREQLHQIDEEDDNNTTVYTNDDSLSLPDNMIWVSLKDHPPEAVKLLLEYCYTNRVTGLGKEAFVQASKGAVPPHQSWPSQGLPTVSMVVALAGIALAEEARMPRLSLMCEVSASCLLNDSNVLDALSRCTEQAQTTGNRLPILRKKAMSHLLYAPLLKELSRTKKWMRQLEERKDLVVPALLQGALEAMSSSGSKRKRVDSVRGVDPLYDQIDDEDKEARNLERLKRRTERQLTRSGSNPTSFVWHPSQLSSRSILDACRRTEK